ncbi:hypothetical protein PHMEG_00017086 [Phytophthora megakarya]|uniref:Uncharacterized protein n=1 Tax=Phytophthora megakarya TaxID=4795 RepID=A0A225VXN7_9STRA|nr:hypothetical protein PHMEG_00017086 [Phytophthora megakarya]
MELSEDHPLYSEALAATQLVDERLESSTRSDYNGNLRRFAAFCEQEGYPNPLQLDFKNFRVLHQQNQPLQYAEKLRAARSWHYSKPAMSKGGHPVDRWLVEQRDDGGYEARGDPANATMISQIMTDVNKVERRECVPVRAPPTSLSKLTTMIKYLQDDNVFNKLMCRVGFSRKSTCRHDRVLSW